MNSNKVAIARALEEELKERRRGNNQHKKKEHPENFPDADSGKESREIAAEKAGFGSHMTYRRAKQVVDKGVPEMAEAMDAGGRVWKSPLGADLAQMKERRSSLASTHTLLYNYG